MVCLLQLVLVNGEGYAQQIGSSLQGNIMRNALSKTCNMLQQ